MSAGFAIDWSGLDAVQAKFQALGEFQQQVLLDDIGALVESQTRRRIHEEKESPDDTPWPDWSEAYAAHRHGFKNHKPHPGQLRKADNHTLLELRGHLLQSIMFQNEGSSVDVGSNLVYAAAQFFGTEDIPARQALGLSPRNERDVLQLVESFMAEVLQ